MVRTKYYHTDEVAELLNISTDEVCSMLKKNELKGYKKGRRWLIDMNQPKLNSLEKEEDTDRYTRYIKDSEHENIIRKHLYSVKKSLYIATGNFKKGKLDGNYFSSILDEIAQKGKKVIIKCMNPHGHEKEKHKFKLVVCKRNHMKLFIFDEKVMYIGSANLTEAAIGRNEDSRKAFNHEAGILTTEPALIKQALRHFEQIGTEEECKNCKIKICPGKFYN